MTQIKQIFADLSICKSTKYNQWSSVASASSACHFIFRPPFRFPRLPQRYSAARLRGPVAPTSRLPNRDGGEPGNKPAFCLGWTKGAPWLDEGTALAGRRQKDVFFRSFKTMNYAVF